MHLWLLSLIIIGQPYGRHEPVAESSQDVDQPQRLWTAIPHTKNASLVVDNAGKPLPFILRLQLLDCIFDIPSSSFKLEQESLDLVTLSFVHLEEPENTGVLKAGTKLGAKAVQRAAGAATVFKQFEEHKRGKTLAAETEKQRRHSSVSITRKLSALARRLGYRATDEPPRGSWNPSTFPRRRQRLRILVRTSQRVVQAERAVFDIFLTSTMVVRNNTSLGLQLFSTVPGPFMREPVGSFLEMYHEVPPEPSTDVSLDSRLSGKVLRSKQKEFGSRAMILTPTHRYTKSDIEGQRRTPTDTSVTPGLHVTSPSGLAQLDLITSDQKKDDKLTDLLRLHTPRPSMTSSAAAAADDEKEPPYGSTIAYHDLQLHCDYVTLEPFEQKVKSIPLHWLACSNSALWATFLDEKLFIRRELRDLTRDYDRADLLLEVRYPEEPKQKRIAKTR